MCWVCFTQYFILYTTYKTLRETNECLNTSSLTFKSQTFIPIFCGCEKSGKMDLMFRVQIGKGFISDVAVWDVRNGDVTYVCSFTPLLSTKSCINSWIMMKNIFQQTKNVNSIHYLHKLRSSNALHHLERKGILVSDAFPFVISEHATWTFFKTSKLNIV